MQTIRCIYNVLGETLSACAGIQRDSSKMATVMACIAQYIAQNLNGRIQGLQRGDHAGFYSFRAKLCTSARYKRLLSQLILSDGGGRNMLYSLTVALSLVMPD